MDETASLGPQQKVRLFWLGNGQTSKKDEIGAQGGQAGRATTFIGATVPEYSVPPLPLHTGYDKHTFTELNFFPASARDPLPPRSDNASRASRD